MKGHRSDWDSTVSLDQLGTCMIHFGSQTPKANGHGNMHIYMVCTLHVTQERLGQTRPPARSRRYIYMCTKTLKDPPASQHPVMLLSMLLMVLVLLFVCSTPCWCICCCYPCRGLVVLLLPLFVCSTPC